jgi:glycosyltransferase involved in cell wall biosynthesis
MRRIKSIRYAGGECLPDASLRRFNRMTMPTRFVSVIIPTYSRPHQLVACLQALARQDYPRSCFEVIVVDDGGREPLDELVAPFRDRVTLHLLWQHNAGPAEARNLGARHAQGNYLAFTDDDCHPATNWLATMVARCACLPRHLIGGRTVNGLPKNPYSAVSQAILDVVYDHFHGQDCDLRFFASNNFLVPTEGFWDIAGFNPRFRTSEDRDFCDRWIRRGYGTHYEPAAVIYHAHHLTFMSFWRQHMSYGRGAWNYHRARARRGAGSFRPDLGFYAKLLRSSLEQPNKVYTARQVFILTVAQLANAAGFAQQAVTTMWRSRSADPW